LKDIWYYLFGIGIATLVFSALVVVITVLLIKK
jgi:hypothetical protein